MIDPEVVCDNNVGNAVVDATTLAEVLVFWRPPSDAHVQAVIQLSAKFVIDLNKPLGCGELVLFLSDPCHWHSIQFIAHVKQWFLIVDLSFGGNFL